MFWCLFWINNHYVIIITSKSCQQEGSRPESAMDLATAEPLQRERLGDRGQMVVTMCEPKFRACNASFMFWMSLLLAVNTKNTLALLFFKDIISQMNRRGEMCSFFSESRERKNILTSLNQKHKSFVFSCAMLDSTIHLVFWHHQFIWPVSSDVVLLPWLPSATVCTKVLSARKSSLRTHQHHCPRPLPLHVTETPFTGLILTTNNDIYSNMSVGGQ